MTPVLSFPLFATVLKIEKALQACKGLMTSRESFGQRRNVGAQLIMVGIGWGLADVRLSIGTCQTSLHSRLDLTRMGENWWHTQWGRFIRKVAHPNPHCPQHFSMSYRVEARQVVSFSMFSFRGRWQTPPFLGWWVYWSEVLYNCPRQSVRHRTYSTKI